MSPFLWAILASLAAVSSAAIGLPLTLPTVPVTVLPTAMPTMPSLEDFENIVSANGSIQLPQIMYFPDDNGDPKPGKIYGNATKAPVLPSEVFFQLYTRSGPQEGELLVPGNEESLKKSHFNSSHHTYFVTHGFLQSINAEAVQGIKDMYLGFHDANVIAIDWSRISSNWLYFIVKMQITEVAQFVAGFVAFLVREGGVDATSIHLIGHSLGAHVVGMAGKYYHLVIGKKVGQITGLDPAGPLFSVLDPSKRIDRDDALFVQVIHTCGGWLGMSAPIGQADFYPNGGYMRQPGCPFDFVLAGTCSHSRSWRFFAESINSRQFSSQSCASYAHYKMGDCVEGAQVPMGHYTPDRASGLYFLRTADRSPFALG